MHYSKLFTAISSYVNLEEEDEELVKTCFKHEYIGKGQALIDTGETANKAFFILTGYLKYFKMLESGEELIVHFSPNR